MAQNAASESSRSGGSPQTLQRRWNRAVAAVIGVSAVAGLLGVVIVDRLVGDLRSAAEETERETGVLGELVPALNAQQNLAHKVIDYGAAFAPAFLAADRDAAQLLDVAEHDLDAPHQAAIALLRAQTDDMYAFLRPIATDPVASAAFEASLGDDDPLHSKLAASFVGQGETISALNEDIHSEARGGIAAAQRTERNMLATMVAATALVVLLIIRLGRRFRRDVIRPIHELASTASAFGLGDLERRAAPGQDDELGHLARSFNSMANAISADQVRLSDRANLDFLTGLANRSVFEEVLARSGEAGREHGVLLLDLDDFKFVNDSMGHAAGDRLLQLVSERLSSSVRAGDVATRIGGDEFAVLLASPVGALEAMAVAQRILDALEAPFLLNGVEVHVGASIGVSLRRADDDDQLFDSTEGHSIVREADAAMYLAKGRGKRRALLYDAAVHTEGLDDPVPA